MVTSASAQGTQRQFRRCLTVQLGPVRQRSFVGLVAKFRTQPVAELGQRHLVIAEDSVPGVCRPNRAGQ